MKAVVTQISGRRAVLLRQDGTFAWVHNRGYRIGQQIAMQKPRKQALRPILLAASLVLVMLSATAFAAETLPFSYISVDVNPSMQMTLNWFDRVLSIEAVNGDAEEIAAMLTDGGIAGKTVDTAMQMIYTELETGGYFTGGEENDVVVAVASYGIKDVGALTRQLEQMQTIENSGTKLNVTTVQADQAAVALANTYATTPGKLALAQALANGNEEELIAWLDQPVREMIAVLHGGADAAEDTPPDMEDGASETVEPPATTAQDNGQPDYSSGMPAESPQPTPEADSMNAGDGGAGASPDAIPGAPAAEPGNAPVQPGNGDSGAQPAASQQPFGSGNGQ